MAGRTSMQSQPRAARRHCSRRGAFEVEDATLAPGRREVVYSSNQGDINRRHLWKVAAGGGTPAALTAGQARLGVTIASMQIKVTDVRGKVFQLHAMADVGAPWNIYLALDFESGEVGCGFCDSDQSTQSFDRSKRI